MPLPRDHHTAGRLLCAGQEAEQGRFPGAIGANEGHAVGTLQREGDVAQHHEVIVSLGDILEGDDLT